MKFNIEWTETVCYQTEIEADSVEEVLDKFSMGMFEDRDIVTAWVTTNQDSIEIWEARDQA